MAVSDSQTVNQLMGLLDEEVPGVIEQVSPQDQMYENNPPYYLEAGRLALRSVRLAMLGAGKTDARSILDLPSGHGRVLRFLKAAFPEASLTACDINRDGVDFCAEVLGATPVYSAEHPRDIPTEGPFDLIWVGSLLTHLDLDGTRAFLDFFESVLDPDGGVLVFTTHGRMVAERIRIGGQAALLEGEERQRLTGDVGWGEMTSGLKPPQVDKLVREFERDGFGYTDWFTDEQRERLSMPVNYGISAAMPSWVCSELERRPALRLVSYREGGWGPQIDWWSQDVVGCVKVAS